jgi:methionyl-tRNA synthetase
MPETPNPKAATMSIRFSDEHKAWIEEQARLEGISPSEFVRYLVMRERRSVPAE